MEPTVARDLWRVLEPVHEACYRTPETAERFGRAGLDTWALEYVAVRASPLGAVPAGVVTATFYGFAPELLTQAVPLAWELVPPARCLELRLDAVDATFRRVLGDGVARDPAVVEAAALAREAAEACERAGRPLAAANLELPWPEEAHLVLWQAATVLREHRGDGHVASLITAGLGPVECHVVHAADGAMPAAVLQRISGWSDQRWQQAVDTLVRRGLLDRHGGLTEAGRAVKTAVEHRTDRLAMTPWEHLGPHGTTRLAQVLGPVAARLLDSGIAPAWREREARWQARDDQRRSRRPLVPPAPRVAESLPSPAAVETTAEPIRVTVVTKGHPFEPGPFFAMFDANPEITWLHVEHPEAQKLFHPRMAATTDVFVLYDMPGIVFEPDAPPRYPMPSDLYMAGFHRLLAAGQPFVFLHHAIAGWPAWAEYAEIIGGRFNYSPAVLRGRRYPDSGYRHGVAQHLSVVDPTHPIVEGLGEGFDLVDEVYLCPVFESSIIPLLRSDFSFVDTEVFSAARAVQGHLNDRTGWRHPPGSNVVAWVKRYDRSPIVYLQPGDGPSAYANPSYRRLLANAIRWAASPEAKAWAASG